MNRRNRWKSEKKIIVQWANKQRLLCNQKLYEFHGTLTRNFKVQENEKHIVEKIANVSILFL